MDKCNVHLAQRLPGFNDFLRGQIRPWRREIGDICRKNLYESLARGDVRDSPTVYPEVRGNIVLPIPAVEHAFRQGGVGGS